MTLREPEEEWGCLLIPRYTTPSISISSELHRLVITRSTQRAIDLSIWLVIEPISRFGDRYAIDREL
jgi:hypothetical protein